jgi:hypothetical protein
MDRTESSQPGVRGRLIISAVLLLVFLGLIWKTGRAAISTLLTATAVNSNSLRAADVAVTFDANDANAHYERAVLLEAIGEMPAAVDEYRKAALSRPADYALWLTLARAHELNGNSAQAIAAATQAVPLAPFYSQTHYVLGNILLRAGQFDAAFKELRIAGASNKVLMPGIIDLAWRFSGEKVQAVEQAIAPTTASDFLILGQFFKQHKELDAAVRLYIAAGSPVDSEERNVFTSELVAQKDFTRAATLWNAGRQNAAAPSVLIDPGFEQETDLRLAGFGWRLGDNHGKVQLSLDPANAKSGHTSLKIDFNGDPDPFSAVVSQLVLIDPGTRYELKFASRSERLVSGGLPLIEVDDAMDGGMLSQSEQLPANATGWRDNRIEFSTRPTTRAVQIVIKRSPCGSPCPIFGSIWLDEFQLRRL